MGKVSRDIVDESVSMEDSPHHFFRLYSLGHLLTCLRRHERRGISFKEKEETL